MFVLNVVFIFPAQKWNCQWQKTGQFALQSMVRNLAWHPTGTLTTVVTWEEVLGWCYSIKISKKS